MQVATISSQQIKHDHLILGTWIDVFEYTEMEYTVALQGEEIVVSAVDRRDIENEHGEVNDIHWDGERLYFTIYWQSTGNSTKCQFFLISPNRIMLTHTSTEGLKMARKQLESIENTGYQLDDNLPIVGEWIDSREYGSALKFIAARQNEQFVVSAMSTYDNEQAEIYNVYWDEKALNFSMYWQSTGRFMKCQFLSISSEQLLFIYTYTEKCILTRESGESP